jgi:hypothetical protein
MIFSRSAALANLARISKLKAKSPDARERAGFTGPATVRLQDARQAVLSLERSDNLACNVAHAVARLIVAARARGIAS